jgi:hypothetical protein
MFLSMDPLLWRLTTAQPLKFQSSVVSRNLLSTLRLLLTAFGTRLNTCVCVAFTWTQRIRRGGVTLRVCSEIGVLVCHTCLWTLTPSLPRSHTCDRACASRATAFRPTVQLRRPRHFDSPVLEREKELSADVSAHAAKGGRLDRHAGRHEQTYESRVRAGRRLSGRESSLTGGWLPRPQKVAD